MLSQVIYYTKNVFASFSRKLHVHSLMQYNTTHDFNQTHTIVSDMTLTISFNNVFATLLKLVC